MFLTGALPSGFAGTARGLAVDHQRSLLITVGLDRFLRIHKMDGTRDLLQKVYLKHRLTDILIDTDGNYNLVAYANVLWGIALQYSLHIDVESINTVPQVEADDELWKTLETVEPKKKKRKLINSDD